jgi:hypothetical protein
MIKSKNLFKPDYSGTHMFLSISTSIIAVLIIAYVLFVSPRPGVADQGDFQRVMSVTGLQEIKNNTADTGSHFFKFVTTQYKTFPLNPLRLLGIIPTTSMIYPIALAKAACRVIDSEYFSTHVLSIIYSLMYISALFMCLKWSGIKRTSTRVFLCLLSLVILLDGNYIVWFNSLYGEPMMMIGLLLLVASVLFLSERAEHIGYREIIFVSITSLLFLGAKLQCIPALPLIIYLIFRTAGLRSKTFRLVKPIKWTALPIFILFFYVGGIYVQLSATTGVDTKYNSVFYGILKNSENPEKDLELLGLSSDLAVEAGKHAYLPRDEYVKYVPWSQITEKEFNQKISNLKLLKFYLLNPKRFISGMEYTASQSFDTMGFLGKYEKSEVDDYTYTFNRFTFWSGFRSIFLPKKLSFIVLFYIAIFAVSIIEYLKKREDKAIRLRIELLWLIAGIGILQFPMPYVGNGEADTAKQLFLFNYTFDILIITACTWIFEKACKISTYLSTILE